ncbi:MAG: DUF1189 family protein [Lachnospiraceae bacterium]|nr:DUF1189 family protein [Lachnospiraceae bacterium]
MTFSEQIVYAMFKPAKYKEILKLKKRRAVLFVVVLMLVLGIVRFVVPTASIIAGFGGFESLFSNKISALEYSDGKLSIEQPFIMNFSGINVMIDTSVETITDDMLERDGTYFAIGSKQLRCVVVADEPLYELAPINLNELLPEGFNNAMMLELIPGLYLYMVIYFLILCVGFFIKYGFLALIFSLTANGMNKMMELRLSFGEVFMICFYGQTFGIILSNFTAAIVGYIPMFISLIGIFISIHMITSAILHIKGIKEV